MGKEAAGIWSWIKKWTKAASRVEYIHDIEEGYFATLTT